MYVIFKLREEDLPMELQEQNWFSAASALRVYGQYLNLDRDHNGMLSINELAGYVPILLYCGGSLGLSKWLGVHTYKMYFTFLITLENSYVASF